MRAFIFDTETTDLINSIARAEEKQPKVIEFYGAIVEDGAVVQEVEFLCNPGHPLAEITTKITGIKTEDVADQLPFNKDRASEINMAIMSCQSWVAHNLAFDRDILRIEFNRLQMELHEPEISLCTVEATEHFKGYRLSLTALHEELFGEAFPEAHRARHDVEALIRCYNELRKRDEI